MGKRQIKRTDERGENEGRGGDREGKKWEGKVSLLIN